MGRCKRIMNEELLFSVLRFSIFFGLRFHLFRFRLPFIQKKHQATQLNKVQDINKAKRYDEKH